MARIVIELDDGEEIMLQACAVQVGFDDGPDPGEEEPDEEEDEFVDATGTGDRIYPFRGHKVA